MRVLGILTALLLGAAAVTVDARAADVPFVGTRATVSVDFEDRQGELVRTERLNNFGNVSAWPEQRSDDVAFLNDQGLHGDIYRVWLSSVNTPPEQNVFNQCDLETGTCDFSPEIEAYLTDASNVSDSVLVVLNPSDFVEGERPLEDLEPLVKLILRSLKEQYPHIAYVEVFNEPDFEFNGQHSSTSGVIFDPGSALAEREPTLQPEELYPFYVPFYEAANQVNAELQPEIPLRVGGPALTGFNTTWLGAFLDGYAADPAAAKRLDFISYHGYGFFDDDWNFHMYKEDPSQVATQRAQLEHMLASRGISTEVPALVTETGIYPGPSFDEPSGRTDYARNAAGIASLHYWFSSQPDTYAFNWCVRHRVQERKDQLVTRASPGQDVPEGIFTPYGNMMLMQSKMKDTKVAAASDSLEGGQGVYAVASRDGTGASVMVWNYQHINNDSFQASVDMANLPQNLRDSAVREQVFRIDQTTSNYFTDPGNYLNLDPDPDRANLQLVEERLFTPGQTYTKTLDLGPNAIYLILLEPATSEHGKDAPGPLGVEGHEASRAAPDTAALTRVGA